ncbi:MAG: prolyl oligopeptidase family serine peptidase [Parvularculaceae bacterium]
MPFNTMRRRFAAPLCAALATLFGVPASIAAEDDVNALTSADVFEIEYAAETRISPDGSRIAYVRKSHDVMTDKARSNIWLVDADGSNHRPVASSRADFVEPRWSPDGTRLAYVSGVEAGEGGAPQIYVYWAETGATAHVTNLTKAPRALAWSPDGTRIAFVMDAPLEVEPMAKLGVDKPEDAEWSEPFKVIEAPIFRRDGQGFIEPARAHVFVVPSDGGAPRQLTSGDFNHDGPLAWTPDGTSVVFAANRHDNWALETIEADLFAVDLAGKLTQITDAPGAETQPTISPDGETIAYVKSPNEPVAYWIDRLRLIDRDGANDRPLTADFDRSVARPEWAGDGSGLYFLYDDRGERYVGYTDLEGERRAVVRGVGGVTVGRPYTSGDYTVAANGTIAYTVADPARPADVGVAKDGAARRVTELNEDALGGKRLGDVTEITYASDVDGEEIQGWYVTPPNFDPSRKHPLILEIHGGPHAAYGPHFSLEIQRYAAEGYVVFYDNHRGSSSYGERFGLLLQHKYPSKDDFGDHMSGVDAMLENDFIDADNLFVAGGSAGGVATAYLVGLTDRFNAAVAAKPIINWTSKVLTADSYVYQSRHQFPGLPWEAFDHYWARSPLSLAGNVTTPTLLMTGEEDYRTPITESEQFYQALTLRGVDTALVRVPGSSHGIAGRPSRLIGKVEHTLAWFARYEKKDATPAEAAGE